MFGLSWGEVALILGASAALFGGFLLLNLSRCSLMIRAESYCARVMPKGLVN